MITGAQFNTQYKGTKFVKLTNESCCHNGYQYTEGLNIDTLEFNPNANCSPGGFYFCEFNNFSKWIKYTGKTMHYMWDIEIPNDAKVSVKKYKIKCDKFIISNKTLIWNSKELCLEAAKQNKDALRYVNEELKPICLEYLNSIQTM